ncbi:MAG: DUF3786 domain-containing protein [Deltaproteobacteria bacterium]|nr:DUF3786 domain-containing protein [Deltaproteobacteria bacterium]
MARVDDYIAARRLALEELCQCSFPDLARDSGYTLKPDGSLVLDFLDRTYRVTPPDYAFEDEQDPGREVPIQEQVLILHYLQGAPLAEPAGEWVAFREIPGAAFYHATFAKRAIEPVKQAFGENPQALDAAAPKLGGKRTEPGNHAWEFAPFPKVPLRIALWRGDDELPSDANVLFDKNAGRILSPEDLAWLAGMVVYRLMALGRG